MHFPQNFSETVAVPRLFLSDHELSLGISMTYTKMHFTYMANIKRKKDLTLMICLPAPNILLIYNLHIRRVNASALLHQKWLVSAVCCRCTGVVADTSEEQFRVAAILPAPRDTVVKQALYFNNLARCSGEARLHHTYEVYLGCFHAQPLVAYVALVAAPYLTSVQRLGWGEINPCNMITNTLNNHLSLRMKT